MYGRVSSIHGEISVSPSLARASAVQYAQVHTFQRSYVMGGTIFCFDPYFLYSDLKNNGDGIDTLLCRRNFSPKMKSIGNQYYDHVPDKTGEYSVRS
jgi:hypothetical protein